MCQELDKSVHEVLISCAVVTVIHKIKLTIARYMHMFAFKYACNLSLNTHKNTCVITIIVKLQFTN